MSKLRIVGREVRPTHTVSYYRHAVFGRVSVELPCVLWLRHVDLIEQRLCVEALPTNRPSHKRSKRKNAAAQPAKRRRTG